MELRYNTFSKIVFINGGIVEIYRYYLSFVRKQKYVIVVKNYVWFKKCRRGTACY